VSNANEMAENKLILLYIMELVKMPISDFQITQIILENRLMNYFVFQQLLDEIISGGLAQRAVDKGRVFYSIVPEGGKMLDLFPKHIPEGIKSALKNIINSKSREIKKEVSIIADYTPESESKYTVSCEVREGDLTLIDLKVAVGSKEDAKSICGNWKSHASIIYRDIIETLTKHR